MSADPQDAAPRPEALPGEALTYKPATTFDSHVDAALAARPAETPEGR